eukprot:UN2853
MVLALNVSVYFCKLLPLHMNGNLPVGIGMHVFAMICDLIQKKARKVEEGKGRARTKEKERTKVRGRTKARGRAKAKGKDDRTDFGSAMLSFGTREAVVFGGG